MKKWKHYEDFKRDRLLRKIKKEFKARNTREDKKIFLLEKAKLISQTIGINN